MNRKALVVWRLCDGKRGHERQSEGLIGALSEHLPIAVYPIKVATRATARVVSAALGFFHPGTKLPAPDLIIGAGRATNLPLLAARRAHGGRAVCLMRPGLPLAWFDACIIPRHDLPPSRSNIITSEGPLNPMRPGPGKKTQGPGLILLGGPSRHHHWDDERILQQVERIIALGAEQEWLVCDSRRSPEKTSAALARSSWARARYVCARDTAAEWLPQALAVAETIWVSADSIAMLYEALSTRAAVGIIDVPPRRDDRIARIAPNLIARGWARSLDAGNADQRPPPLQEAQRCAKLLLQRWPDLSAAVTA